MPPRRIAPKSPSHTEAIDAYTDPFRDPSELGRTRPLRPKPRYTPYPVQPAGLITQGRSWRPQPTNALRSLEPAAEIPGPSRPEPDNAPNFWELAAFLTTPQREPIANNDQGTAVLDGDDPKMQYLGPGPCLQPQIDHEMTEDLLEDSKVGRWLKTADQVQDPNEELPPTQTAEDSRTQTSSQNEALEIVEHVQDQDDEELPSAQTAKYPSPQASSQNESPTEITTGAHLGHYGVLPSAGETSYFVEYADYAYIPSGLRLRFLRTGSPITDNLIYAHPRRELLNREDNTLATKFNTQLSLYLNRANLGGGAFGALDNWRMWPKHSNSNPQACAHCIDSAYVESELPVLPCTWLSDDGDAAVACSQCAIRGKFCIVPIDGFPVVLPCPQVERVPGARPRGRTVLPSDLRYWVDPVRRASWSMPH